MNTTSQQELETRDGAATTDHGDAGIPLGTGGFGETTAPDPFAAEVSARRLRSSSFILVLVVVLAGVGLFLMRSLTRVSSAASSRTEIETTIENFLKALSQSGGSAKARAAQPGADSDRVLAVLSDDFTEKQVPLSDVHRNPFIIYQLAARGGSTMTQGGDGDAQRADDIRRSRRIDEISQLAAQLRLKSIMLGAVPLANLNGQIVRVGDRIKIDHSTLQVRVSAINKDSLLVQAVDAELGLTVEKLISLRPVQ